MKCSRLFVFKFLRIFRPDLEVVKNLESSSTFPTSTFPRVEVNKLETCNFELLSHSKISDIHLAIILNHKLYEDSRTEESIRNNINLYIVRTSEGR